MYLTIVKDSEFSPSDGLAESVSVYGFASRHISASQVTSGAALCERLVRASMMALILLMVECEGELAA